MSRPLRIARVTVTSWPTPNGHAWWSWVENDGGELSDWLESLPREVTQDFEVTECATGPCYVMGWKLPRPDRRHYLSPAAARRWAADARRLGAIVDVELSDPVVWSAGPEPAPQEPAQLARRIETVELPEPAGEAWTSPF